MNGNGGVGDGDDESTEISYVSINNFWIGHFYQGQISQKVSFLNKMIPAAEIWYA